MDYWKKFFNQEFADRESFFKAFKAKKASMLAMSCDSNDRGFRSCIFKCRGQRLYAFEFQGKWEIEKA